MKKSRCICANVMGCFVAILSAFQMGCMGSSGDDARCRSSIVGSVFKAENKESIPDDVVDLLASKESELGASLFVPSDGSDELLRMTFIPEVGYSYTAIVKTTDNGGISVEYSFNYEGTQTRGGGPLSADDASLLLCHMELVSIGGAPKYRKIRSLGGDLWGLRMRNFKKARSCDEMLFVRIMPLANESFSDDVRYGVIGLLQCVRDICIAFGLPADARCPF